jgi:hypothetical protein
MCDFDFTVSSGFEMAAMAEEVYGDAIIDVVPSESLLSAPIAIKVP